MNALKYLGYIWSFPNTLIGFVLLAFYRWNHIEWRDGCLEVIIKRDSLIGGKWVGGQTFGWLIFYKNERNKNSGSLNVHERVHVRQGLIGGPLFLLAYGLDFLWQWGFGLSTDWNSAYFNISYEQTAYDIQDRYASSKLPEQKTFWGHR